MEKIFKKSLAFMISAAICLTAFIGCLTVNAEATAPAYTITAQNGKAGDTVKVNVDGTNITSVCGQQVFINIPSALAIASVKDADGEAYVNVADVAEGDAFDYNVVATETTKQVRFADIINFDTLAIAEFHIVFELTIPDTAAVGDTYTISFDDKTMFADIDENVIDITVTPATITVQAAVAEPVLDENITCTFGAGLSTTAYISFRFTNTEIASYNSVELVVTRNTNDSDFNFKEISTTVEGSDPVTGADYIINTGTYTYYYYYGIELYSLTVPVSAVLYCKDTEGNVIAKSSTFETTLKDALVSNYNKTSNSKVKTAIADMIVAGAEVQQFVTLSKQSSQYATELALPTEGFDTSLATAELGTLASYNTPNNGDVVIAPGAAVGASPYLSFNMSGVNTAELSDYNLNVSYYDPIYKITVSKVINLASEDVLLGGSKYYAYFYDMAIYATNAEVTAKLYKGESTVSISTYSYSFDTFISARMTNANMGSTLIALGKLGQSFRAMNGL